MGFEYRILADLSKSQVEDVVMILKTNHFFHNSKVINNCCQLTFGNYENSIPKFTIQVSTQTLDITRYDTPKVWQNLDELQKYFKEHSISHEIKEDF